MSHHLNDSDFKDDLEKWEFLRTAPPIDAQEPLVRSVASSLFQACGGNVEKFVRLAMAYVRDVVLYQTDTERVGQEDIQPKGELSDIILRGVDDCDGKARLFCALCIAEAVDARMVAHWEHDASLPGGVELSHVSAELIDFKGRSHVPVELTLYRARLGEVPKDIPKERSGHWLKNEVAK